LFMVGLSTLLMTGLGIWIMVVANETTKVSMTSERGHRCPKIPAIQAPYEDIPAPPPTTMKLPDKDAAPPPKEEAPPKDAPKAGDEPKDTAKEDEPRRRPKIQVQLDEMEVPKPVIITPPVPENFGKRVVDHWTCELQIASRIVKLEEGRLRILLVLIAAGILLVIGLAAYGLKMTHRVAGPLFKVQLYLAKMRDGRFDKVYNLRKGDQLVDFYEHFKDAHAGVVKLEKGDIERIKKVIVAAEGAGAGDHPSIVELRTMLARKEKSVE
jgi:hypothetical protein